MRARTILGLKIATHLAALTPLAVWAWQYGQGRLGADPIGELTRRSGRAAIIFLFLSLVPTVVRILTGYTGLLRVRRALGLYAFMWIILHFLVFAGLDYRFDLSLLPQAIRESSRVIVGIVALLILIPLAVTSTNGWVRRLGRNWRRLHRLAYLAAALAVLHYVWIFKELRLAPVLAGVALLLLLLVRIPAVARSVAGWRRQKTA